MARQHALPHPDPTPRLAGAPAGSPSVVWPLVAVGGCIAVAAIGVLTLQSSLTGPSAIRATPGGSGPPDLIVGQPASSADPDDLASPAPTSDPVGGGVTTTAREPSTTITRPTTFDAELAATLSSDGPDQSTFPLLDPGTTTVDAEAAPVYGVYATRGREDRLLGSFAVIGGEVVTSASAVTGRSSVWVRVESHWLRAEVAATDPLTDVAMFDLIDDEAALLQIEIAANGAGDRATDPAAGASPVLPSFEAATEPVETGDQVMVGYGDLDPPADLPTTGSEQAAGQMLPPSGSTAAAAAEVGRSGEADGKTWAVGEGGDGTERAQATTDSSGRADAAWLAVSERRGLVYDLHGSLLTPTNRLICDPIRVAVDPQPGDAGSPVRDADGRLVGLVVPSATPQVVAVPIDRVAEAVDTLRRSGSGDSVRLGIEVRGSVGGLTIDSVDGARVENGGAVGTAGTAGLVEPGDVIVAVDGEPIVPHRDHLRCLARAAGPGGRLTLTVERPGQRQTIDVRIGVQATAP